MSDHSNGGKTPNNRKGNGGADGKPGKENETRQDRSGEWPWSLPQCREWVDSGPAVTAR